MPNASWLNKQPFVVLVTRDFYDGPVGGLLRCRDADEFYRFTMLDWDLGQKVRVFGLSHVPPELAADCLAAESVGQSDLHGNGHDHNTCSDAVNARLEHCVLITFLVAWHRDTCSVVAVRDVAELALTVPSTSFWETTERTMDWFGFLQLPRKAD
jgi:hypothetical protein